MTRKRSAPEQPSLGLGATVTCKHGNDARSCEGCEVEARTQAHRGATITVGDPPGVDGKTGSDDTGVAYSGGTLQLDRMTPIMAARDDERREATIATFCECAAIVARYEAAKDPSAPEVLTESERILAELRRRYANHPDRIQYHMHLRGLS